MPALPWSVCLTRAPPASEGMERDLVQVSDAKRAVDQLVMELQVSSTPFDTHCRTATRLVCLSGGISTRCHNRNPRQ